MTTSSDIQQCLATPADTSMSPSQALQTAAHLPKVITINGPNVLQ